MMQRTQPATAGSCAARTQGLDFVEIVTANRVHRKAHACQNAVSFGFHNP